jgi:hypothetical protein
MCVHPPRRGCGSPLPPPLLRTRHHPSGPPYSPLWGACVCVCVCVCVHPPRAEDAALRFKLYSAHDTTLVALLNGMGVCDGINPPYNSTVFFELYGPAGTDDPSAYTLKVS